MVIENKKQLKEILQIDRKNAGIGSSIRDRLRQLLFPSYSYKYVELLRIYSYYRQQGGFVSKIYQYRLVRLGKKLGFYIPKDVFGPGLYIPHFGSIIVNPHAVIGKNCLINNNVVIGQIRGKAPVIGDNVYIGPGAVIPGDIHIPSNVYIGANAVVTKSFAEEFVLIAGIPARVVCKKRRNWIEEKYNNY